MKFRGVTANIQHQFLQQWETEEGLDQGGYVDAHVLCRESIVARV